MATELPVDRRPGRTPRALLLLLVLLATPSCFRRIYYHVTRPLDVNFDNTPVCTPDPDLYPTRLRGDTKRFRYFVAVVIPVADLQWDSNAIAEIADKAGFLHVHYADLETLDVLGIWRQQFVHLYGE